MNLFKPFALRLPTALYDAIKKVSEAEGKSLNYLIISALAEKFGVTVDMVHRAPKTPRKK